MGTEVLVSKLKPDPCKDCSRKEEDDWGLVCDLACGKATDYDWYKQGARDMLTALKEHGFISEVKNVSMS